MPAIKRVGKRRFEVDFVELKRKRLPWFRRLVPLDANTLEIDPQLITDALRGVMSYCERNLADGQRLVWNEFRFLLNQEDHDDLRNLRASLRDQFAGQLNAERERMNASTVGDFTLRLQVDEAEELSARIGIIEVDCKENLALDETPVVEGEMTIRIDKKTTPSRPLAPTRTNPPPRTLAPEPLASTPTGGGATIRVDRSEAVCVLRWPGGEHRLASGPRYLVGRDSGRPITGYTHMVPLNGASNRISSRAFWIEVNENSATIGRPDHGSANAVAINGELIEKGREERVTLPAVIQLTGGELTLRLERG